MLLINLCIHAVHDVNITQECDVVLVAVCARMHLTADATVCMYVCIWRSGRGYLLH